MDRSLRFLGCVGAALLAFGGLADGAGGQPAAADTIGAVEGGRVAFESPPAAPGSLVYLTGSLSEERLAELRAVAPNVRIVVAASREEAMRHAPDAHGVDGRFVTPEFLASAPNLVWVQSPSAGVERYLELPALMEADRIVLTNMQAVHGPAIADHAMAMLLTLTRNMPVHLRNQREERWGSPDARRGVALEGKTMFVVGLGGIGTEVAERAHGFGMRVIASRRSDRACPDYVERVGRPEDLLEMLAEADVVAVCVPLTGETEGMFDEAAFGSMREGSYLINVARGGIVDTDALVAALESGRLAGACLDVTDPEPLPAGHPLWGMPNVVITPHVASEAPQTDERWWALLRENVRRFGAGEPLLNTVDKGAGY